MEQPLAQNSAGLSVSDSAAAPVPASLSSAAPPPRPLPMQDLQTLSQLKRGNWAAMEQLVVRYQDRLLATVLRMVSNPEDAADLVQETFVKAMQNVANFEGKSSLYTWLFRIAVNLSISHQRAGKYRKTTSLDGAATDDNLVNQQASNLRSSLAQDTELDPAVAADQHLEHEKVMAALATLEPDFRAVLVLRDIEDCDYQQIADILELPVGTIKSRLFRARSALRDAFAKQPPHKVGEVRP